MSDVTYRNGDEGIRTLDLRIANATLSQLSYVPDVPPPYGIHRAGSVKELGPDGGAWGTVDDPLPGENMGGRFPQPNVR